MEDILYFAKGLMPMLVALPLYFYLVLTAYPFFTLRLRGDGHVGDSALRAFLCKAGRLLGKLPWFKGKRGPAPVPSAEGDRGRRRFTFCGGRAVVYEPTPAVRRYIPAYALMSKEGCTYLLLQLHPRVAYIRYDVLCMDSRGRLLDLLQVSERITAAGESRPVRLPTATAYTRVIPRQVDKMYEDHSVAAVYSPVGMVAYAALVTLTTTVVGYLFHRFLWDYLLSSSLGIERMPESTALALSACVGLLTAAALLGLYYRHIRRRVNR